MAELQIFGKIFLVIGYLIKRSGLVHIDETVLEGIVIQRFPVIFPLQRTVKGIVEKCRLMHFQLRQSVCNEGIAYGV